MALKEWLWIRMLILFHEIIIQIKIYVKLKSYSESQILLNTSRCMEKANAAFFFTFESKIKNLKKTKN